MGMAGVAAVPEPVNVVLGILGVLAGESGFAGWWSRRPAAGEPVKAPFLIILPAGSDTRFLRGGCSGRDATTAKPSGVAVAAEIVRGNNVHLPGSLLHTKQTIETKNPVAHPCMY